MSSISRIKSRTSSLFVLGAILPLGTVACSAVNDEPERDASGATAAAVASAPDLPSPRAFARALDLECYRSEGTPPVDELGIRQLNPVIKDKLPNQRIRLGSLTHTCLPVAKNNNIPNENLRRFVSQVDLACYDASAERVDVPVNLRHINPVLQGLPDHDVRLKELAKFCTPVRKNFAQIDPEVRRLVSRLDFACYAFEEFTPPANVNLLLTHLNPVVQAFGFPNRLVQLKRAKHLCVPVAKNQEPIPEDVRSVVEWVDFMQYNMELQSPEPPDFPLWLQYLNPLFAGKPPFVTWLTQPTDLLVPVAKNNQLPPI